MLSMHNGWSGIPEFLRFHRQSIEVHRYQQQLIHRQQTTKLFPVHVLRQLRGNAFRYNVKHKEQEVQELSDVQAVWLKCIRNRQNRWKVRLLIHCRESLDLRLMNPVRSAGKIDLLFSVFRCRKSLYAHQFQDGKLLVPKHHGWHLPDQSTDTDIHFCLLDRFQVLGKKQWLFPPETDPVPAW